MNERNELRQLVLLCKILVILILALIIVELFINAREVKAATITGETQLAGISLLRQQVIDKGLKLPEQEDIELLAEVMYHENWHTDREHLAAYYTGAVVMNRVMSPSWPNTVRRVLYQKGQYSTTYKFFTVPIPKECYDMAKDIMIHGTPVPRSVVYQAMFRQGSGIWQKVNTDFFCYE